MLINARVQEPYNLGLCRTMQTDGSSGIITEVLVPHAERKSLNKISPRVAVATYSNELEFLQLRRNGVGSSDIAAVLGLSEFKSKGPRSVYDSKIHEPEISEEIEPYFYWGHKEEGILIEAWIEITSTRNPGKFIYVESGKGITFIDEEFHLIDNPDALVFVEGRGWGRLELKTMAGYLAKGRTAGNLKGDYLLQVQHAMETSGLEWCEVVLKIDRREPELIPVFRDAALGLTMREAASRFFADYVIPEIAPNDLGLDLKAMVPAIEKGSDQEDLPQAPEALIEIIAREAELRAKIKELTEEADILKGTARDYLEIHDLPAIYREGSEIYKRTLSSRVSLDTKALKVAEPGTYAKFSRRSESWSYKNCFTFGEAEAE